MILTETVRTSVYNKTLSDSLVKNAEETEVLTAFIFMHLPVFYNIVTSLKRIFFGNINQLQRAVFFFGPSDGPFVFE